MAAGPPAPPPCPVDASFGLRCGLVNTLIGVARRRPASWISAVGSRAARCVVVHNPGGERGVGIPFWAAPAATVARRRLLPRLHKVVRRRSTAAGYGFARTPRDSVRPRRIMRRRANPRHCPARSPAVPRLPRRSVEPWEYATTSRRTALAGRPLRTLRSATCHSAAFPGSFAWPSPAWHRPYNARAMVALREWGGGR